MEGRVDVAKVGVILSGCGVFDGSEIHEAVCLLLVLDQSGADVVCMAPNKLSADVIDHWAQKPMAEKRNVLVESARIARGKVVDLAQVDPADFDAFILPGGFGAAKNLCDFAMSAENCRVDPQVARVLRGAQSLGKPIGLACIAPVIAARLFGETLKPSLTIGHDSATAGKIDAMGARHRAVDATDVVVDEQNRLVTTPCYMEAKRISEAFDSIQKMVAKVLEMVQQPVRV
jgi:enhancing lycopene biosynthesis protein 2